MEPGAKVTVIVFTEETWWPSSIDEDMTNTHMTKAQAKIEFKAQSTLKSDLFASPVRTAGAGLTKKERPGHTRAPFWAFYISLES